MLVLYTIANECAQCDQCAQCSDHTDHFDPLCLAAQSAQCSDHTDRAEHPSDTPVTVVSLSGWWGFSFACDRNSSLPPALIYKVVSGDL